MTHERLRSTWPSTHGALPAYGVASAAALVLLCLVDGLLTPARADVRTWVSFACMAGVFGALHGALWKVGLALVSLAPRRIRWLPWPLAMLCLAAWLAHDLGVFARLGSRHHAQALGVLFTIVPAALATAAVLCMVQPTARRPTGWIFGLSSDRRRLVVVALLVACVLLFHADFRLYVGLYPSAHRALRAGCLLFATLAIGLLWPPGKFPRLRSRTYALIVVVLLVPVAASEWLRPHAFVELSLHRWAGAVVRMAQRAVDVDRDGYSSLFGGGDCAELDAAIHPGAREIAGNGRDDNCVLGDRPVKPTAIEVIEPARTPASTDVVLITVDTLRPDHVGLYNPTVYGPSGRNTTPNLDRWSHGAHVFHNAFTTGAWTVLALSSVMRGVNPRRIHWTPHFETSLFRLLPANEAGKLLPSETLLHMFLMPSSDSHVTLATLLRRRGMRTVAVVDDGFSMMLHGSGGFDRGFDEYRQVRAPSQPSDAITVERAIETFRRLDERQRHFVWVHMFGPHGPNEARPGVPTYGKTVIDGYDHEVRFMDAQLGRLLDVLSRRTPQPVVIVAGDHGEFFSETNRWHGYSLEEDTMRIPLLIKIPGAGGGRIDATVSIVDLFPTILALTDTPGPTHSMDGVDLEPLMSGVAQPARIVVTDCWRYDAGGSLAMDWVGVTDGARFMFYDRLANSASNTVRGSAWQHWRGGEALMNDPLGRFALGYLEEVPALPR